MFEGGLGLLAVVQPVVLVFLEQGLEAGVGFFAEGGFFQAVVSPCVGVLLFFDDWVAGLLRMILNHAFLHSESFISKLAIHPPHQINRKFIPSKLNNNAKKNHNRILSRLRLQGHRKSCQRSPLKIRRINRSQTRYGPRWKDHGVC